MEESLVLFVFQREMRHYLLNANKSAGWRKILTLRDKG